MWCTREIKRGPTPGKAVPLFIELRARGRWSVWAAGSFSDFASPIGLVILLIASLTPVSSLAGREHSPVWEILAT